MECYYLDKHCHDSHRNAKANLINCWYICCWRITAIKILYGRRHDWKPFMNSDVEVDPACYNLSWHRLRSDKNPKKVALISIRKLHLHVFMLWVSKNSRFNMFPKWWNNFICILTSNKWGSLSLNSWLMTRLWWISANLNLHQKIIHPVSCYIPWNQRAYLKSVKMQLAYLQHLILKRSC